MEQAQQPHYQQKRKPKALLVVGLILNILASVGYLVGLIVVFVIIIATVAIGTTTGAVVGGEQAAQDVAQEITNDPSYNTLFTVFGILSLYALFAIPLTIVALVLSNKANGRKMALAAGILAIIASIPTILIPFELVAGIRLVSMKDEDFVFDPNYWHD